MISEIEVTPSYKKARCVKCSTYIKRLEIRGKKNHRRYHPEYICEKCLAKEISELDDITKELKEQYNNLVVMNDEDKEKQLYKIKILKKLSK